MNPTTLRRVTLASLILTLLLAIDGTFMVITNYNPDDTNSHLSHLSDGVTVLIAAALLLIITIISFVLSRRPSLDQVAASQSASVETESKP